jgi:hypothetical protein
VAQEEFPNELRDGHRAADRITRLRALFSKKDVMIESVDLNFSAPCASEGVSGASSPRAIPTPALTDAERVVREL